MYVYQRYMYIICIYVSQISAEQIAYMRIWNSITFQKKLLNEVIKKLMQKLCHSITHIEYPNYIRFQIFFHNNI